MVLVLNTIIRILKCNYYHCIFQFCFTKLHLRAIKVWHNFVNRRVLLHSISLHHRVHTSRRYVHYVNLLVELSNEFKWELFNVFEKWKIK